MGDVTRPAPEQIERQVAVPHVAEQPKHQRRMADCHLTQATRRTYGLNELVVESARRRLLLSAALTFRAALRIACGHLLRGRQVEDVYIGGGHVAIPRFHPAA